MNTHLFTPALSEMG